MENPASVERDGYVEKADILRAGEIPMDTYHPLLYPILASAAGRLVGGSFAGARAVSTIFAAMFCLFTYLLARTMLRKRAALFVLGLMLLNCWTTMSAMDATTDMTFAAFSVMTLYFLMRFVDRPTTALLVWAAVSFGLAYFTRYSAIFLLPAAVVAVLAAPQLGPAKRAGYFGLFAAVATIVLVPHFIITARVFGSPFYNENWKNLAFKLYGDNDWTYFKRIPYTNLVGVVVASPTRFITLTMREIAKFFFITLSDMGGRGLAAAVFAAGTLGGAFVFLSSWNRSKTVLGTFSLSFIILGCIFFYTNPRLMLPILPICSIFIGACIFSDTLRAALPIGRFKLNGVFAAACLVMLLTTLNTGEFLKTYVHAQPLAEVEAVRAIQRNYGVSVTVCGTCISTQRYVQCRYVCIEGVRAGEANNPELYLRRLPELLRESNAEYLVVGRLSLNSRPQALLEGTAVPDCLELIRRDADVAVYRCKTEPHVSLSSSFDNVAIRCPLLDWNLTLTSFAEMSYNNLEQGCCGSS
jgi:hypothetical protein